MRFLIDIEFRADGMYEANCPDMGLSTTAESLDEVMDKIKTLVTYHISTSEDAGISPVDEEQVVRQFTMVFKDKNFFLPRNPKVH